MKTQLKVLEIVGENAISMQSGQLLYKELINSFEKDDKIQLDFNGVKLFASPFFNASIGYLLKDISVSDLKNKLELVNISEVGRQLLNHVIANAIQFYEKVENHEESMSIIKKNAEEE